MFLYLFEIKWDTVQAVSIFLAPTKFNKGDYDRRIF